MIIKPKSLKKGDTIGIIAPAGPFNDDRFHKGICQIQNLGFNTKFDKDIFEKKAYLAGSDARRSDELHKMFSDQEVSAIFCARGGYGSARLIELIDQNVILENPKIFMGFSDITSLHLFFNKQCSLVSFHGPMVATNQIIHITELTKKGILDVLTLTSPSPQISINKNNILKEGVASGILTGGCMTLLIHSIGTLYEIDTEHRILLLEDSGEPLYRIDRMLCHLKAAGKFDKVAGVVFGDINSFFNDGNEEIGFKQLINDLFYDKDIPIVFGLPFGHGRENLTIPLGVKACLNTNRAALSFEESAVT